METLKCKAIVKPRGINYSYQYPLSVESILRHTTGISNDFIQKIKSIQGEELLVNEKIKELINTNKRKYITRLKKKLEELVKLFNDELKVRYNDEIKAPLLLNKTDKTLYFSFDIIESTLLSLNIMYQIKAEMLLRKVKIKARKADVDKWNYAVRREVDLVAEWLNYQKKLLEINIDKAFDNTLKEIDKIVEYLNKLQKGEAEQKLKLSCYQFYILNMILHEVIHSLFADYPDTLLNYEEVYVAVYTNYVIVKLFDISDVDIVLPVVENNLFEIEGDRTSFVNSISYIIRNFPKMPTLYDKLIENKDYLGLDEKDFIDLLLGNATINNIYTNDIKRQATKKAKATFKPSSDRNVIKMLTDEKKKVLELIDRFASRYKISAMLVYREGDVYAKSNMPSEDFQLINLSNYEFVDEEEFQRGLLQTVNLLKSFFKADIYSQMYKIPDIQESKWKKKSIIKSLLFGTPVRKEYFKFSYGEVFVIVDVSRSMENRYVQLALSAVYSTLSEYFTRIDLTVVQFAERVVSMKTYRNISIRDIFNINPYTTSGNTNFSQVAKAINTKPQLREAYRKSKLVVLISDCEFTDSLGDYKHKLTPKPLVVFYPKSYSEYQATVMSSEKPNWLKSWLKSANAITKEKFDAILQAFS